MKIINYITRPVFLLLFYVSTPCTNPLVASVPTNHFVDQLIEAMTLEEKTDFIGGYKGCNIRGY